MRKVVDSLIDSSPEFVERAVVFMFERQTNEERQTNTTRHTNKKGFTSSDAGYGSYLAKWIKSGKRLSGKHLSSAQKMLRKYSETQLPELIPILEAEFLKEEEPATEKDPRFVGEFLSL